MYRFRSPVGRRLAIALLVASSLAVPDGNCSADHWTDGRVAGPFVCRADFPLTGIESLLNDLARLQSDLLASLKIQPTTERIEIYLFHDESTYRRHLRHYFPEVPYRRALYVKRGGPGMVLAYRSRQLPVDLRHECTHALLHAVLPMVPLWLDEGLAEYFELPPSQRAFGSPHLSGVRWRVRFGVLPQIGPLEKKGDLSEMDGSDYRDAWAWTHFMLQGPVEARDELARFFADIQASVPPGLLSQRLKRRIPDLEHRLATHFKGWQR